MKLFFTISKVSSQSRVWKNLAHTYWTWFMCMSTEDTCISCNNRFGVPSRNRVKRWGTSSPIKYLTTNENNMGSSFKCLTVPVLLSLGPTCELRDVQTASTTNTSNIWKVFLSGEICYVGPVSRGAPWGVTKCLSSIKLHTYTTSQWTHNWVHNGYHVCLSLSWASLLLFALIWTPRTRVKTIDNTTGLNILGVHEEGEEVI